MRISSGFEGRERAICDLFASTFTASEGEREGALIGNLARRQMAETAAADIRVFTAEADDALSGAAIFTRLRYDRDERTVFLLGPMAVASDRQRQGVGQRLLRSALDALREDNVDVALTYGDPKYYARVGFVPITQAFARAPFELKHPEGWLGQSLSSAELTPLLGPSRCVDPLADPDFW